MATMQHSHAIYPQPPLESIQELTLRYEALILVVALIWSLIGLLVWMELYYERRPRGLVFGFILTILCEPAAFLLYLRLLVRADCNPAS